MLRAAGTMLVVTMIAACAGRPPIPAATDPDPERARAALATLLVDNRTTERLAISYRHTSRDGGVIGIGTAPPGAVAEMAPVPAGEPLILMARTAAGTALALPPRTLALDGSWTWVIERSARFLPDRNDDRSNADR